MIKINIKNIIIWLIIVCISIALILSNFAFYDSNKNKSSITKVNGYDIKNIDIDNVAKKILHEKQHLKEINKINNKLKNIVINNIFLNIQLMRQGLVITNKELLYTILSMDMFKKNDYFSEDLYKNYLADKNVTEVRFQDEIQKVSIQNKFRYYINYIDKKSIYKKYIIVKNKAYDIKKTKTKTKINKKYKFVNNKINQDFFINYIDLSIKNTFNNVKLNKDKLIYYKSLIDKKNKLTYIIKIKCVCKNRHGLTKMLWLTENECQNKTIFSLNDNNVIIINDISLKLIKKIHKAKIILDKDILNKYKKQKSCNYIEKHYRKLTNKNIKYIAKILNLDINNFNFEKNGMFFYNKFINDEARIFRFNKYRYIKSAIENDNKIMFNNINIFIDRYLNKINKEKIILGKFLQIKKLKKENTLWQHVFLTNTNNILPFKSMRILDKSKNKYMILKYKKKYYFIDVQYRRTINTAKNYYSIIKKSINQIR